MPSIISAGTTSNTALNFTADTTGVLQLQTNGTTAAVTIDTSQNVGIGTASPSAKLDVRGNMWVRQSDGSYFNFTSTSTVADIEFSNTPALRFVYNATTERMRINSSGSLLLGTTDSIANITSSSGTGLALYNSSGNTQFLASNANDNVIQANRQGTDGVIIALRKAGTVAGTIDVTATGVTYTGTNGITFTATQTASAGANTLDDYEEGTFTPLVSDGTTTASLGTSYYVKVGQLVHINVPAYSINVSALNAGSLLRITGLPFAKNATFFAVILANYGGTDKTVSCGDGASTTFNLYVPSNGVDYASMTRNTFGGNTSISFRFSVSYRTDS